MQCIEDTAPQRNQRDQQQIRERDPRQRNCERELMRLAREPGSQELDRLWRERERERQQNDLRGEKQRKNSIAELFRRARALFGANTRIGRNECRIEGTLGKNRAKMIWQPERNEECVRHRAGADDRGEHDVTEKPGEARKQRVAAYGKYFSDHLWVFSTGIANARRRSLLS